MQLCVRGKEAGRFPLLLLSPLLAFLGHQEKALGRRTGGSWAWGARRAWCNILASFVCLFRVSPSLAPERAEESRLTLEQGLGGKREAEKRGGEETRVQRVSCLPFRGTRSPGHV